MYDITKDRVMTNLIVIIYERYRIELKQWWIAIIKYIIDLRYNITFRSSCSNDPWNNSRDLKWLSPVLLNTPQNHMREMRCSILLLLLPLSGFELATQWSEAQHATAGLRRPPITWVRKYFWIILIQVIFSGWKQWVKIHFLIVINLSKIVIDWWFSYIN